METGLVHKKRIPGQSHGARGKAQKPLPGKAHRFYSKVRWMSKGCWPRRYGRGADHSVSIRLQSWAQSLLLCKGLFYVLYSGSNCNS